MAVIEVQDVVKEFRRPQRRSGRFGAVRTLLTRDQVVVRAVDGVSFTVDGGEFVGYLGPNGAGKSTTIKMLTGILVPSAGNVTVAGATPWRERRRNAYRIGVVFGQRSQLWWDLPLRDSFDLLGRLYRVPGAPYRENLGRMRELLDLDPFLDTPVRQLSLGQRMRGDLAAAMLHDPTILFLDEPTVGLDVVAKERVRDFLAELNREIGTTVILTTHDLDDVEQLCRRIVLIDQGRVLYDGGPAELKARYLPYRELMVQTDDLLLDLPGVTRIRRHGSRSWLRFDPAAIGSPELVKTLLEHHRVTDLSLTEPRLDAVIRAIYAGGRADAEGEPG